MHRITLGLAVLTGAMMVVQTVTGLILIGDPAFGGLHEFHFFAGVFLAMFVSLIHTIVMFHLIGTGKEMKEDLPRLKHSEISGEELRSMLMQIKMRVFPITTLAIALIIAAEVTGGASGSRAVPGWVHQGLSVLAIVVNFIAFLIQFGAIRDNFAVMFYIDDHTEERHEAK